SQSSVSANDGSRSGRHPEPRRRRRISILVEEILRYAQNDEDDENVPRGTMTRDFDVIVIGGGHAGAEAARVCARGGVRVAMITMLRDAIRRTSANPAIGGL